ncbi:hypothetical protein HanRHA438_Chr03g0120791 [Helianthus annuus]|uniref:Uncharacterized protein n=1 Tax=Helianthus annuus TaxID=4232 RepID=A0A251V9E7_HELAN|nr:hypothetical protein HanXRQr2_Chr03g0108621 [Helianthus annuus]KAJ0592882.1 hypothetical protein HanHA300_Chr03g0090831 [Helianthus annuus]KAJ0600572.1 hypothetical protein HanIR_Chr03g0118631 [Helianthus annuus]KAJ0607884.1 hypothetical protein HanHA89_Chr03g0102461 [Helianthus annuus]KAJ0767948.1 hypothetical protein HanLR1_Chr03g0095831 [Helianthus annuus]
MLCNIVCTILFRSVVSVLSLLLPIQFSHSQKIDLGLMRREGSREKGSPATGYATRWILDTLMKWV